METAMTIEVASTTDTPEQVLAAKMAGVPAPAVDPAPEPAGDKKEPDGSPAAVDPEVPAPTEPKDEEEEESEAAQPQGKKKGGFQKKIDKLTRQLAETRALLDARTTPAPAPAPVAAPVADPNKEPEPEDYESHAAYVKALTKFVTEQTLAKDRQQAEKTAREAEAKKANDSWEQKLKAGRAAHDDFDEVLEVDVKLSPAMVEAITTSDLGAEIAYFLGNNPEEGQRIAALSPVAAAREIGKLEVKLAAKNPVAAPVVVKPPKPAPPAPAGGGASAGTHKDPSEMNFQEFKAWRKSTAGRN